jgi:hypothetical protein
LSDSPPEKEFPDQYFGEDAELRFEEELAKISAERDTIEKAHLTLMEEHQDLKTKAVHNYLLLSLTSG